MLPREFKKETQAYITEGFDGETQDSRTAVSLIVVLIPVWVGTVTRLGFRLSIEIELKMIGSSIFRFFLKPYKINLNS